MMHQMLIRQLRLHVNTIKFYNNNYSCFYIIATLDFYLRNFAKIDFMGV